MMITAIPMKAEHIASHFSKADRVAFINEQGQLMGSFAKWSGSRHRTQHWPTAFI